MMKYIYIKGPWPHATLLTSIFNEETAAFSKDVFLLSPTFGDYEKNLIIKCCCYFSQQHFAIWAALSVEIDSKGCREAHGLQRVLQSSLVMKKNGLKKDICISNAIKRKEEKRLHLLEPTLEKLASKDKHEIIWSLQIIVWQFGG